MVYKYLQKQTWLYDIEHDSMHPQYRRVAHLLLRAFTRVHAVRYTLLRPDWAKDTSVIRLNLGSGRKPLSGWINVDLNPFSRAQLWMDIRDPWPLADNQVTAIYIRHCLEHFTEKEVLDILAKCHRVLSPGKGMRIGVPSLELAIERYQKADFSFAPWVTDHAKSPGRQFFSYIMDNGNHGIVFDYSYLAELLELSGFKQIQQATGGESRFIDPSLLSPKDNFEDLTLYVECKK